MQWHLVEIYKCFFRVMIPKHIKESSWNVSKDRKVSNIFSQIFVYFFFNKRIDLQSKPVPFWGVIAVYRSSIIILFNVTIDDIISGLCIQKCLFLYILPLLLLMIITFLVEKYIYFFICRFILTKSYRIFFIAWVWQESFLICVVDLKLFPLSSQGFFPKGDKLEEAHVNELHSFQSLIHVNSFALN